MAITQVDQLRSFNRTVTERVGALNNRFLERSRPSGEARCCGRSVPRDAGPLIAVATRPGLGHASRLLRALEADRLVRVEPSPSDRRVRVARLTPAGLSERALLDQRSDDLAMSLLAPLDSGQRDELVAAMRTVQRLLMTAVIELRTVDPAGPDARRCIRAYFAELDRRSESGFNPASALPAEPHELVPPRAAS